MKITKSKTKQSTDEQKKEIRSFLNDYQSINNDTTITEKAKMVLSMLLYTGNEQDKFTVGYNYIEEVTGISKNGISAIIGRLEKKGFISRTKGERGKNSEYTINYDTMKSYVAPSVSKCPKKVYKCTSNQVSKCTTCTPNTTCTPTCTPKSTDFQVLTNKIDELIQVSKCTSELLEKIYNLYLNININNNINLKDNILNNDNTEEYNTRDQNIKENSTKDNLEILKENSTVEIPNDEDIQSEIENTLRDNISDNEIPSDLPPLNIDDFFEDSNDNLIEYRSNENNISDELELSIFGNDIISEDENLNNDTTVKFIDGKFQVVSETEDEINSSSDVEDKNKINLNLNNMNNSDNTISKVEISNNENLNESNISNENFKIWGKLQMIKDLTSGSCEDYLFTEYENLNDSKNVSDGYHQVKRYISLVNDQIKASVSECGTWGILSFKDNVYSFIPCNNNNTLQQRNNVTSSCAAAEASKNANTDVKMQQVDNYTTTEDKTLKKPLKMRPVASEDKTVTPTNEEKVEITTNNAPQATEITQVDNYTTDDKKVAPVQPQTANPDPSNPKVWEYLKLRLTMKTGSYLMRDVLDEYKAMEAKNIHSVIAYMEDMCKAVRSALAKGIINEMQFNDFKRVFSALSKGKYNYWRKVFSTRKPQANMISEKKMWEILGKPKVVNEENNENTPNNAPQATEMTETVNNTTTTNTTAENSVKMRPGTSNNNVVYPNLYELYKMEYDDAIAILQKFVAEHPNLSNEQKVYFNENISSAFGIQLYDND